MQQLSYRNQLVRYQVEGTGPTILLLHGFCEDHRIWDFTIPALSQRGYRIICPDLPGFGMSAVIPNPTLDDYADCMAAILVQEGAESAVVIGHSMGGYVTLALASKYPARVRGLGLFHSHPFADSPENQEARQKSIDFIDRQGSLAYVKQLIPKLFPASFAASQPEVIEALILKASEYPATGIQHALHAMATRPDRTQVLHEYKGPVLLLLGREDALINPIQRTEMLALPALGSIHLLAEVGHMGMYESPDSCRQILLDYLTLVEEQASLVSPAKP